MTLTQLRYVIEIANSSSMNEAAKNLFVSQPSLSGSIRELENEIRDFCNGKLAEYKWIRTIEFVDEMPKTISGKIQKNVQREQA